MDEGVWHRDHREARIDLEGSHCGGEEGKSGWRGSKG